MKVSLKQTLVGNQQIKIDWNILNIIINLKINIYCLFF